MTWGAIGKRLEPLAWLLAGAAVFYFSNGRDAHPVAAWVAPILLLRFSRLSRPWLGAPVIGVVVALASFLAFEGLIPGGPVELGVVAVAGGVTAALVYLLDRLIAPRLGGLAATLVFPAASVTALLLGSLGAPFGTWGNDAYVQYDFGPLARFAAVAGVWGVAFMPSWFAALANQWLEAGASGRRWASTVAFAGAAVAVLGFGLLAGQPKAGAPTVMAGLVGGLAGKPDYGDCRPTDGACRQAALDGQYNDPLFARSAALAARGAGIVAWHETAAVHQRAFEPAFLDRASRFAVRHDVYLVAGVATLPDAGTKGLIENKVIVFSPDGRRSRPYLKAHPVPGEPVKAGDGQPLLVDTRHGRLAAIICFDADFPETARRAAKAGAGLLVIPSNDWRAITPSHAEMAAFRAIETGLPILRPTANGLSAVIDPGGRITARRDGFAAGGPDLLASVALSARPTLQRQVGDAFAHGCAMGLALLGLLAVFRRRRF